MLHTPTPPNRHPFKRLQPVHVILLERFQCFELLCSTVVAFDGALCAMVDTCSLKRFGSENSLPNGRSARHSHDMIMLQADLLLLLHSLLIISVVRYWYW